MVVVAQLVRASVCGTEGRRFEPGHPPKRQKPRRNSRLFLWDKFTSLFYEGVINTKRALKEFKVLLVLVFHKGIVMEIFSVSFFNETEKDCNA